MYCCTAMFCPFALPCPARPFRFSYSRNLHLLLFFMYFFVIFSAPWFQNPALSSRKPAPQSNVMPNRSLAVWTSVL